MFGGCNYSKLKTNLKLSIQRLKLLEKKKSENAMKSTKEIADFVAQNKYDRARIKVEHIIREDYTVEGMEIIEMYNDLLLARFGLLETMKTLEPDLQECVSSIIWATPRLEAECPELKIVAEQLANKFGKEYANECKIGKMTTINPKLMQKLSEQAPSRLFVEKYLYEIAHSHKVHFKPDPDLALQDYEFFYNYSNNQSTTNTNSTNNNTGGGSPGGGGGSTGGGISTAPVYPQVSFIGFNPLAHQANTHPRPQYKQQDITKPSDAAANDENVNLPDVPQGDSFDDLTKRFEKLRKN